LPVSNMPTPPLYNLLKENISRLSPKSDVHQGNFAVLKYRRWMWIFDSRRKGAVTDGITVWMDNQGKCKSAYPHPDEACNRSFGPNGSPEWQTMCHGIFIVNKDVRLQRCR
jgi:hypothetical protein